MNYLDIISQNNPIYEGYKNWISLQDSGTKQKLSFFVKIE